MSMKGIIKYVLCTIGVVIGAILLILLCFNFAINCKKTLIDTSISPDGTYELTLIEIGEPAWPFGAASGRLILNEGNTIISQKDFELRNDGCQIGNNNWAVTWNESHVEVILSGEEQYDEQFLLYYDGTVNSETLYEKTETDVAEQQYPIILDMGALENGDGQVIFSISIEDYSNFDISVSESENTLDSSLKTTDEEKAAIQSECIVISELYREIYQQAPKVPSQYFGAENDITQETIDEIENILIAAGYSVINSDSIYPEYLEHSDCVNAFWECVKQQTDAEVSFWGVSSTGGLYYRKFCFIDGKSYGIFAGADWKDDGKLELLYAEKREIFYWDMTYNADFIYRDLYLDRHWDAAHLLRLHPVDKPMYDLTMKYILPIGYHNVNLFLLDWSSDDYGNLCFNDLLDYLYRLKYNDYLYARDYPRYTTPYSYSAIPAKLFEDTIVPYFDISMEEFRERALYDAENDIYPWQDISCDNVLYFPSLIPEVTECIEIDDSTKKLIVNVMCPDYQTDKLFVHEVTIRVLSDGEYQYIGNQITCRSDINIPSPQARIPVQRFSMDR